MNPEIITVPTTAFDDQKPGTSGLRKKVQVFQQPHYLENFVQSVFDALPASERSRLVVGGDGRFHNEVAAKTIVAMAVANGFEHVIVGQNALLSTPAASCVIREKSTDGGLVLSASHNPGGPNGDFGIKFNNAAGAPAPESITDSIFANTRKIEAYRIAPAVSDPEHGISLARTGTVKIGGTRVEVIDSVADYEALMMKCFDFDRLADGFKSGKLSVLFDAMHAVTGPYARRILVDSLGAAADSLLNATPLADFGNGHPDPNLVYAKTLVERMHQTTAPVLGAASDGDGDRNLIHGPAFFVTPSDSLALLARHARLIPQFADGLAGVARSMPTSAAVDRVAEREGIECHVTPTGWKFFGNLLDAGRIGLCGEESFGTGGDHIREKDGLWTVLAWLSIVERLDQPVGDIVTAHWKSYGRNYYCRYDYEKVDVDAASAVMQRVADPSSRGRAFGDLVVSDVSSFSYEDPIDASVSENQGMQVHFENGSRFVTRLSGTGTEGATVRLYLERYEPAGGNHTEPGSDATRGLAKVADEIAGISALTGREKPDVIT